MTPAFLTEPQSISRATTTDATASLTRFFLIGSERSGTTMLRLMLDHHPELSCMYESLFLVSHYEQCARAPVARYMQRLETDRVFRNTGLHFPEEARSYQDAVDDFFVQRSRQTGKRVVGATIHHEFHLLPILFPDARFVHLVRDGRPVSASIKEMGWNGNVYFAARRWRRSLEAVHALRDRTPPERWFDLRYEDLLTDVETRLGDVCSFLEVGYDKRMLAYSADSTYEQPDPANATRWRKRMSPREICLAEMAAGDLLETCGYARVFPPAHPGALERFCLRLHDRIGRVAFNCRRYGAYLTISRKLWRMIGVRRPALEARADAIAEAHIK